MAYVFTDLTDPNAASNFEYRVTESDGAIWYFDKTNYVRQMILAIFNRASGGSASVQWKLIDNSMSPYAAAAGDYLQINTTAGYVAVNLPTSPAFGDSMQIEDAALTWGSYYCQIQTSSHPINSVTDGTLPTKFYGNIIGGKLNCVFLGGTIGWSVK